MSPCKFSVYLVLFTHFFALPHRRELSFFSRSRYVDPWPRQLAAGGDDGVRTHDPLLAGQVLSQLSYTPISFGVSDTLRSLKIEQQAIVLTISSALSRRLFGFGLFLNYRLSKALL